MTARNEILRQLIPGLINQVGFAKILGHGSVYLLIALMEEGVIDEETIYGEQPFETVIQPAIDSKTTGVVNKVLNDALAHFARELNLLNHSDVQKVLEHLKMMLMIESSANLFEELLDYKHDSSLPLESQTPQELYNLLSALIGDKVYSEVYNPFAGIASFALTDLRMGRYLGEELNQRVACIGNLRLLVHHRSEAIVVVRDSQRKLNRKFDLVISIPPFSILGTGTNGRSTLLENGIEALNAKGRLLYVMAYSVLYQEDSKQVFESLCKMGYLEAVITLPVGLWNNASIKTCIIIADKSRVSTDQVRMIDASKLYYGGDRKSLKLDYRKIVELYSSGESSINSALISSNQLLQSSQFTPESILFQKAEESIVDGVKIAEVVVASPFRRLTGNDPELYQKINPSHLNNNIKLNYGNIFPTEGKNGDVILDKSCFLINTFNTQLKFSYFEFTGDIFICAKSVIPVVINESRVSVAFLAKQLMSSTTQDQIKIYSRGAALMSVSKSDFLKIIISAPPIITQLEEDAALKRFFHESDRNLQILESLETQVLEQGAYLRHSIAGPVRNVLTFFKKLIKTLEDNPELAVREIWEAKSTSIDEYTFKRMIEIIQRDLLKIEDVVRRQLDVQTQILNEKLAPLDIDNLLFEYCKQLQIVNPDISIEYTSFVPYLQDAIDKEPYVSMNGSKRLLSELLDNLFDNARKHAFTEGFNSKFLISLNYDESGDIFLEIANSGRSFPAGFSLKDYISKNHKSGDNAGSGFGGWFINEVVKKHKGSLEIENNIIYKEEIRDGYTTSIYITLPLINE